jgi:hypothetical protein
MSEGKLLDFDAREKLRAAEAREAAGPVGGETFEGFAARMKGAGQSPQDRRLAIAKKLEAEWQKHVSPPGTLKGLPPLLEARRLEYQIPDEAFGRTCMFDKILLFQIPMWEGGTYGDTSILMPETGESRVEESAPRGVIISAGLQALDILHSHGSGLGHRVLYVHMSPWRVPFMMISGHELYLIPLRVGDLVADEDTAAGLLSGELGLVRVADKHRYMNAADEAPAPLTPKIAKEF